MDDLTGQLYGGYQLIEHLHRGGEADIYTGAKPPSKEEIVAIRIFRADKGKDEDIKRRYQREVEIYQKLTGAPYIIRPLSYGEENKRYYIVMPYIAKGSLKDAINYLSPGRCLTYIKQAAEALSCIHKEDYMHRDVKPKNLLLGDFGILLSDFGLACEVTTTPLETRGDWGSLFYIAPEQRNGYPCKESDQYSLAMTMCKLLAEIESKADTQEKVHNKQTIEDSWRERFPKIFEVYKKATDKNPENRYKPIIEFKEALEQARRSDLGMDTTILIRGLGENDGTRSRPTHPPKFPWKKVILSLLLIVMLIVASVTSVEWAKATAENQNLSSYIDYLRSPNNTLTVTTLKGNDPGSLRQIIDAAKNKQPATIRFDPSLQGTIELTKDLEIPADVNIVAPTDHQITIIPQDPKIKIHVPQGSVVSFANIDFKGDSQERSSTFIVNEGTLHMRKCHISGFKSTRSSGALENRNGTLIITQSEIDNNQSSGGSGGAIYNENGTVILDNSEVYDNQTRYNGGGINSLNGHVFIKNRSSIYRNTVSDKLSGGDIGGGGGMSIRGGTLLIVDSSIENNRAPEHGGGILLIGTSAHIDNTYIQHNQTQTTQAGGIDVEHNPENNHRGFLILAQNPPLYNNDSSDFAASVQGMINSEDSANKYIIGKPSTLPPYTTFPQFLGYLTQTHFQDYCNDQQNSQKSPSVEPSSGAQKIICTFDDGKTLELSTQNGKVNQVCAMLYPTAKDHLARLFRYTEITTWQCFKDEQPLSNITSNMEQPLLNKYCQDKLNGDSAVNNGETAYDWYCKQGKEKLSINMDSACQYVTRNPFAIAVLEDYNNPRSWQCWGPR